jgi:hypothetical protein
MAESVPDDWAMVRLTDICDVTSPYCIPEDEDCRCVTASNPINGLYLLRRTPGTETYSRIISDDSFCSVRFPGYLNSSDYQEATGLVLRLYTLSYYGWKYKILEINSTFTSSSPYPAYARYFYGTFIPYDGNGIANYTDFMIRDLEGYPPPPFPYCQSFFATYETFWFAGHGGKAFIRTFGKDAYTFFDFRMFNELLKNDVTVEELGQIINLWLEE